MPQNDLRTFLNFCKVILCFPSLIGSHKGKKEKKKGKRKKGKRKKGKRKKTNLYYHKVGEVDGGVGGFFGFGELYNTLGK